MGTQRRQQFATVTMYVRLVPEFDACLYGLQPHSESIPMATKVRTGPLHVSFAHLCSLQVHINVEHTVEIESDTEPDNDASKTTL